MWRSVLKGFDKGRLRLVLLIFFVALAVPTAVLIYQARSQLKWEAFHQHRVLAEELAVRIDGQLRRLIAAEEARSFGDYSFLVLIGDPAANYLQPSPISKFPVDAELPGLIAYFQVDAAGDLSTPLVPPAGVAAGDFGIPDDELSQRLALERTIRQILYENQLVEDDRPMKESKGQAAFDELSEDRDAPATEEERAAARKLGRVEDLKLEMGLAGQRAQFDQAPGEAVATAPAMEKRARRKEQANLPEPVRPAAVAGLLASSARQDIRISTFESEIDPFDFSQLNSGHFVLFRKVWREGQRYIQGVLIEPRPFFDGLFGAGFRGTALSRMSNLIVAWRGDVLEVISGEAQRNYLNSSAELSGALLYQTRLSAPMSDLELIVSINQLPAGPGGTIIGWVTVILAVVLCGGFFTVYRLGVGQIELARQQQDFVSAVSHELKTPLTSIRMYGEMLQAGWADEDKKQTYYDYIYDESERLSRLIENVLQLARMTRNDPQFELRAVRVGELMDMIRSKIGSQVERAGFKMNIQPSDEISTAVIRVDTDCLTQIIINLVDNAIKFSAKSAQKAIDIAASVRNDGTVLFTVRDYGPGISRGQMKKIFRLFYRSENELTRETVGTGIGLALVHQLASAMDGKVDVINRSPGAEFQVSFPVVTA